MFDQIRQLLSQKKGKPPATSSEFRRALTMAEDQLERATTELQRLEGQHADVLLEDDEAVTVHESKLEGARRELERWQAARPRLQERLEEVVQLEADAELDTQIASAKVLCEEGVVLIRKYGDHATAIAACLRRLEAIDSEIQRVKGLAKNAGRRIDLKTSNEVARPAAAFFPLWKTAYLPPTEGHGAPVYRRPGQQPQPHFSKPESAEKRRAREARETEARAAEARAEEHRRAAAALESPVVGVQATGRIRPEPRNLAREVLGHDFP